jgi:MscS family membrane protein
MEQLSFLNVTDRLNEFVRLATSFVGQQSWMAIFVVILGAFILERIVLFIFARVTSLTKRTSTELDDQIIAKSSRPVGNFVLLFGAYMVVKLFKLPEEPLHFEAILVVGLKIVLVLNILWLAWRLMDVAGAYLIAKARQTASRLDDQFVPILQKTAKAFVAVVGLVYIIQALGYSVTSVLGALGIGGLAVAMASKDTISNLFGSIMIYTDRPFGVGDWVTVGSDEGTVEAIGFRSTRIRTFPKTLISIPNSVVANASINNYSRMPKRRVKMTVGVTYDTTADQMSELVDRLRDLLKNHPEVHQEFFLVDFTDFGASSLDILVYYFSKTTDWAKYLAVRQDVNLSIMRIVEEMGLSIAFPTRTVHLVNEQGDSEAGPASQGA